MSIEADPIRTALEADENEELTREAAAAGGIADIAASYARDSEELLGFVLDMSYEGLTIVTCDAWKRKCGGVPKNSFVLIKLSPSLASLSPDEAPTPFLILGRILQAAPIPLSQEVQQTVFQIHKVQAALDPYTDQELQWGALKAAILGTYYDFSSEIQFGNDIDSYVSPHFYEVYVPRPPDLEILINSFVAGEQSVQIGWLRFTESQTVPRIGSVEVKVSPHDFVSNRTALFGKTRMGKSNTIKVVADMMLRSAENVGQIIFDLDGEYSNPNEQDHTSIFQMHSAQCVRYSLNPTPRLIPEVDPPRPLRVNFFDQVELGHNVITSLFEVEHRSVPNYVRPFLEWAPCDPSGIDDRFPERGDAQRYRRAQSMYFALLARAGYQTDNRTVPLVLNAALKTRLAQDPGISGIARMDTSGSDPEIQDRQALRVAVQIYRVLYTLHRANPNDGTLFPASSRTGHAYFDPIHATLLRMIGDDSVSGFLYIVPFLRYHDLAGSDILEGIVDDVDAGRTIIIDLANADETVAGFYSDLVSRAVFKSQTRKFTSGTFDNHSVLFYFEEAHNLFRRDDKDLRSIYNRLAKEGAKNRIGMVYATQSMTTLSPDLLKNTENFFIAHLSDDREIKELTNRYEFRDIGVDVQRSKTKGFVRMITLSHRYALPVQINRFAAEALLTHNAGADETRPGGTSSGDRDL